MNSENPARLGPGQLARLALAIAMLSLAPVLAQAEGELITPNYKDADIRQIIEAVSEVTGQNFIIDARVKAQVTLISSTPMTPEAFYETFLSVLQVYGFVAVPSGNVVKILPDTNARQLPGNDLPRQISNSDEIVTQVIEVQNVGAAQLVPILRPLVPQYGHLAAHPASNMLIISDRAANVNRMLRIIRRIDQAGDDDIEVMRLEHATAGDMVRILTSLSQSAARADGGASSLQLVSDDRTNSILISGDKTARLRFKALIAHLDTPLEEGGNTQVIYLRYADAEELAGKLKEQANQSTSAPGQAQPAGSNVVIWADTPTNALVITAPPKVMRSLRSVIDKLDIRRLQVQVEAILVDLTADKSAELGITWAADSTRDSASAGLTNFGGAANVSEVIGAAASGVDPAAGLGFIQDGLTFGVGRIKDNGTNFAVILRALAGDANTNILSIPSIVTMDNEEAEVSVGQEVPFLTGSFSNSGGTVGAVNPFQTIQREDVGLKLKVTPQINEGDAVIMEIELEVSSLGQGSTAAVDLITNQRTIRQKVVVEDGGIIVLGGLIDENLLESDNRVPGLGRLPIIGNLFKSRTTRKVKRNLMVFISPTILRDAAQAYRATDSKYQYIRELQLGGDGRIQLMPREQRPTMPQIDEFATPPPELDGS
ncbi:MAG: type II secretion system secretin GspD [Gammaproteobacteria bacterium]|nr:type II secretion system secretin GspD [Gammaproteobacteria bacterium]NNF62567.1 type II secretion system secretin GspD [Gammaproteobacteria bacterium]NNM20730.1 type II secretion system secretin GspD [Gammaproteobacteria bacterium]